MASNVHVSAIGSMNDRTFSQSAHYPEGGSVSTALLVRVGAHMCALKLAHVVEVMRPLTVEILTGAPKIVSGLSVIRGSPVPIVSLSTLFDSTTPATRLVVVRTGDKHVALAVDEVIGIRKFPFSTLSATPSLLRGAASGLVETIGALDSELYLVLNTATIIPEEWLLSLSGQEH